MSDSVNRAKVFQEKEDFARRFCFWWHLNNLPKKSVSTSTFSVEVDAQMPIGVPKLKNSVDHSTVRVSKPTFWIRTDDDPSSLEPSLIRNEKPFPENALATGVSAKDKFLLASISNEAGRDCMSTVGDPCRCRVSVERDVLETIGISPSISAPFAHEKRITMIVTTVCRMNVRTGERLRSDIIPCFDNQRSETCDALQSDRQLPTTSSVSFSKKRGKRVSRCN